MSFAAMMLVALAIDAAVGWPDALYRKIGHPVVWLGDLISRYEKLWNHGTEASRRWKGVLITLLVTLAAAVPAVLLQSLLPDGLFGILLGGVLTWPLVAVRSMYTHVAAVAEPLQAGDLSGARHAVSMIVGRDPNQLDQAGVARSALESLAENTSDGIVAPVFWGLVFGLPGIAAYKAINTMDSMIGHRNDRYEMFGKAAARLDDLVNLIPARLTGVLFAAVSGRFGEAWAVMRRDAPKHRSPNAGWPEGAMAAGLQVRLSGPRVYGDRIAQEPWLNGTSPDPIPLSLSEGLALYTRAMMLMAGALALMALI